MHFHLPKPLHGWREFAGEVGIIVIGVLIALTAEQAVEAVHWSHVVRESEAAMRLELLRDDLPQAYTRDAITPCLAAQLGELRQLATAGQSGDNFHSAAMRFSPPDRTWTANALEASQTALAGHLAPVDLLNWGLAYDMVPFLQRAADREQDALREVRRANFSGGVLSQSKAERLSDALDDLETAGDTQRSDARYFLVDASLAGIELSPSQKASLQRQASEAYGDCARPSGLQALRRSAAAERVER